VLRLSCQSVYGWCSVSISRLFYWRNILSL